MGVKEADESATTNIGLVHSAREMPQLLPLDRLSIMGSFVVSDTVPWAESITGGSMSGIVRCLLGDITKLDVDAIVNAANSSLLGGGGVDGAIHRAAGPDLVRECRTLGGCPTGEARITAGYNLPARHVIHTVGPVWHGGDSDEDALLASCYHSSLALAEENGLRTIAFPAISTGIYGFPRERAAGIAAWETLNWVAEHDSLDEIILVCFGGRDLRIYQQALDDAQIE